MQQAALQQAKNIITHKNTIVQFNINQQFRTILGLNKIGNNKLQPKKAGCSLNPKDFSLFSI